MTGIIILAAGSSSRLGRPKQNLVYQGHSLLQRAIETAIDAVFHPVLVVLGANAALIKPTIENRPINIIYNPGWQNGMASSITLGITELMVIEPGLSSVILMLCDQPFINAGLINQLMEAALPGNIVACSYNDTIGTPALFDKAYFSELLQLQGEQGAKQLFLKHTQQVTAIPFPLAAVDIDTIDDYSSLSASKSAPPADGET